jgi:hypothetical protein
MNLIPDVRLYLHPLDLAWMCESLKQSQRLEPQLLYLLWQKVYIRKLRKKWRPIPSEHRNFLVSIIALIQS